MAETLQQQLEGAVTKVTADSTTLHSIVHGDDQTTVNTDGGPVKTLAKAIAEVGDTSNQAVKDLSNVADADFRSKASSAGVPSSGRIADTFRPHAQAIPDMTIAVDTGAIPAAGGAHTEVTAQNSATITAPTTNPRNDIGYVDQQTGVLGVVAGAEAASPADPSVPAGKIAIFRLRATVGMTEIADSAIDDLRVLGLLGMATVAKTDVANTYSKQQAAQPVELTSSSGSIALDASTSNAFTHSFTEATVLANPTGLVAGQRFTVTFKQPASGGPYALDLGTFFHFANGTAFPGATQSANAKDKLVCEVDDATNISSVWLADIKAPA